MASYRSSYFLTLLAMLSIFLIQFSESTNQTNSFLLVKDSTKPQYYTSFLLGTPPFRVSLFIDLSNPWSWFTCHLLDRFTSLPQTAQPTQSAAPTPPALHTAASPASTVTSQAVVRHKLAYVPFSCAYYDDLKGLSKYTKGVLSLARKDASIHGFISKAFKLPHKFALCMPSSSRAGVDGAIYFGGCPYSLPSSRPDLNLTRSLVYTPLVINPVDIGVTMYTGNHSVDYFINVKSILVGGKPIELNLSLLLIGKNGVGGTKLSTIDAYTTLHTQIYKALVDAFVSKAALMNVSRVAPVGSFGACFSSKNIFGSRTGPNVPVIELVLGGKSVWRIYGANSMIKVSSDVRCLAFMDGGVVAKTSIVIGGKQMEDNLIEFDLESSRLGVTSSLLHFGTSCSQFKGI